MNQDHFVGLGVGLTLGVCVGVAATFMQAKGGLVPHPPHSPPPTASCGQERKGGDVTKGAANDNDDEGSELLDTVRPNIATLAPYRCARDDYSSGILLDANENALGAPVKTFNQPSLHLYPDPYQIELKTLVSKYRNCKNDNIFVGVGSDEAIDLIIRVLCKPSVDSILINPPTYGMYKVCANVNDVNVVSVPMKPDFSLDVAAIKEAVKTNSSIKVIFLCSPNNPTANLLPEKDIVEILKIDFKGFVVVDEAYIDFAGPDKTMCRYLNKYHNLLVFQTCSKSFGLAGIRCGFAFGDPRIIQIMNNVKAPYNMNKLTTAVALDAFRSIDVIMGKVATINKERERVREELKKVPQVGKIHHSDANYILFECKNAKDVYKTMADRGVVIRYRGMEILCKDCLRATVGTKDENDAMLKLLTTVAAELDKS